MKMALVFLLACQPVRPPVATTSSDEATTQENAPQVKLFLKSDTVQGQYRLQVFNPTSREDLEYCIDVQAPERCTAPNISFATLKKTATKGDKGQFHESNEALPLIVGAKLYVRSASAQKLSLRKVQIVAAGSAVKLDGFALLGTYCGKCHRGASPPAEWSLPDQVAGMTPTKKKEILDAFPTEMPPKSAPQPTDPEKAAMLTFLKS